MKCLKRILILLALVLFLTPTSNVMAKEEEDKYFILRIKGLEEERFYFTFLTSQERDTYRGRTLEESRKMYYGSDEIFQKFYECTNTGGYYFTGVINYGPHYPWCEWLDTDLAPYKILLYFPEYDRFVLADEVCKLLEYDNHYTLTVSGLTLPEEECKAEVKKCSSDFENFLWNLEWFFMVILVRWIIIGAIEFLVAWFLFKYRDRRDLIKIGVTSLVMQIIVEIVYFGTDIIYMYYYGEFAVVGIKLFLMVLEGGIYSIILRGSDSEEEDQFVHFWYAIAANVLSFVGVGALFLLLMYN